MPMISGECRDVYGEPVMSVVRAYYYATGALAGQAISDPVTGAYAIPVQTTDKCFVVRHNAVVTPGDFHWDNVLLALKMNGADGSTTFTDEKGHTATVTNATISTAWSHAGGSSGYFNGTNAKVSFSGADLALGTADFDVEAVVKLDPTQAEYAVVFGQAFDTGVVLYVNHLGNAGKCLLYVAGASIYGSTPILDNTPRHIRISRIDGFVRLFLDGAIEASGTMAGNCTNTTFGIGKDSGGDFAKGYIDDFRLTKGAGRSFQAFTPDTGEILTNAVVLAAPGSAAEITDYVTPV